jgi:hypothetical protein
MQQCRYHRGCSFLVAYLYTQWVLGTLPAGTVAFLFR